MAFKLKKVINGEENIFLIQKFLEILGDPINDEINIDGDAYRISSFVSLAGSGGSGTGTTYIWHSVDLSVVSRNQREFYLSNIISNFTNTRLYINGVYYDYGNSKAYHIIGRTLIWHGGFELEVGDEVFLKYVTSI